MKQSVITDDVFQKAAKYSHSTVDYFGLVSWSIITRCSNAGKEAFLRIARPVAKKILDNFTGNKQKTRQLSRTNAYADKRTMKIEKRMLQLEERLAVLEKHGVRVSKKGVQSKVKKAIDGETRAVLRTIVEDNKRLRTLLK